MSDAKDRNKHIREYLRYYLSLTNSPGYAVMICGPWGIGKTFLIRQILADHFTNEKDYIYVSLYGVAQPEEIDAAILAAMYPILGTKVAKITGRLLNTASKYFNVEGAITLKDVIDQTTAATYVFDDIERSSMTADAIFGYINQFVEHAGFRVILVANETELDKTDGYRTKREKLVGQTLEAKSAVEGALEAFLENIASTEARNYLKSVKSHIVDLYEQGEVNNLRVLKQTLWDFERLYTAIELHHRQHLRAMLHILRVLFALSFDIKLGRIKAEDIRGRVNYWIAAAMDRGTESAIKSSFDRYSGIDLSDTTLSDELLIELLVRGVVDEVLIKRDLDASSWFFEPNDEPSWRTIWHRFEREEDAIAKAILALESEVAEFHYREPGEILHVFGIMLTMSDAQLLPMDRDSIVKNAKAYISTLRERGDLPPIEPNSFLEYIRNGAWGGLGFSEAGTPHFREIYGFLSEQRAQARIERLPALAERLMRELNEDADLFCRRLVGVGGEHSDLIDGPVLKEIDPNAFLDAILHQPAPVQSQAFQCLLSRHGHGAFGRGLEDERPWVKTLHEAMLCLANRSEPIRRNKLMIFAGWVGQNVQDAVEGDDVSTAPAD
ncbi:P-loop NTPase fold protein [Sphingobium sp. CECT 9361]|uniref:P-loop NTPase fold protein n=1 Tax=Sphingobium sp. CECT 9361 TaxID=2845384 RepID=UPI001E379C27|nr:P-loop NTPase fold protein [Sphingobium sp. CECT 9361]CAH0350103.1 hypothetical protein SPH9361_00940 [Sphingobium sp. CECT 9361]